MQLLEFIPILFFVLAYYFTDIFIATAVLMAAVAVQIGITAAMRRPISHQLKLTFWLTVAFGGLTLAFQDKLFIQWKPTIINWLLAAVLLGSQYIAGRNLIQRMLGHQLTLPDRVWRRLNGGWALGFFVAGALNLFVAYTFSEAVWVSYKLIGGFAITLSYAALTLGYLAAGGYLRNPEVRDRPQAGDSP